MHSPEKNYIFERSGCLTGVCWGLRLGVGIRVRVRDRIGDQRKLVKLATSVLKPNLKACLQILVRAWPGARKNQCHFAINLFRIYITCGAYQKLAYLKNLIQGEQKCWRFAKRRLEMFRLAMLTTKWKVIFIYEFSGMLWRLNHPYYFPWSYDNRETVCECFGLLKLSCSLPEWPPRCLKSFYSTPWLYELKLRSRRSSRQ